ncbi:MAG: hypothetical protein DRJ29_18540, partial [Bacteroidetes bacterium]
GISWIQKGLAIDGKTEGELLGYSLDLSNDGNAIVIGAPSHHGTGTWMGQVRIFYWNGVSWVQKGIDINGEEDGDLSGSSVSINSNGSVIVIGAEYHDVDGNDAGHVRIYEWGETAWEQRGLDIEGIKAGDHCGRAVSTNGLGDVVVIGSVYYDTNENDDAGQARIFEWNGSSWIQRGADINGEVTSGFAGVSVSINNDGDVVAIGEHRYGGELNRYGRVRLFEWDGISWDPMGFDLIGAELDDKFGFSVSVNAEGNIVGIGAIYNDGSGKSAGHVRIFGWNEFAPDVEPPTVPTGLAAALINTNLIEIEWNPSIDNDGVEYYQIFVDNQEVAQSSTTSYIITDLMPNTTYTLNVVACDSSHNCSAFSKAISLTTNKEIDLDPPTPPTGLIASNITSNSFNLLWSHSSDNFGVEGYYIFVNSIVDTSITANSFSFSGLDPTTTYVVAVSAFDEAMNQSESSSPLEVTTSAVSTDFGTKNLFTDGLYNIYPNPTTNQITIESILIGTYTVEITTINGSEVFCQVSEGTSTKIDLSSLKKGAYLITIRSKDYVTIRKIIKL